MNTSLHSLDPSLLHEKISQGNTAEIFLYDKNKIVKLFKEKMPFEAINYEYRISVVLQEKLDNIPKVFDLLTYNNRYGIVYEEVKGIDMLNILTQKRGKLKDCAKKMAQIHASLHKEDINIAYSLKDKLKNDIENIVELTNEEKEKIKQHLDSLPDGNKICHFDFHPGNIMFKGDTPMVIDWMNACMGTRGADMARTCLLLTGGEVAHAGFLLKFWIQMFKKRIEKLYYKEYKKITGISDEEVEQWMLPVAAARLTEWISDYEKENLISIVKEKLRSMKD